MAARAPKKATYAEVLAAPRHLVAEVIAGLLYTHPRPAPRHAVAASVLGEELGPPFRRGRGGPGGWIILDEPELHVGPDPDILVPDLAGWHRSQFPDVPDTAFISVSPNWVCEVLSPSTEAIDRTQKLPVYARERTGHVWLVNPAKKTLEVFRLEGSGYVVNAWSEDALVRAEPFDAIELALGLLWRA